MGPTRRAWRSTALAGMLPLVVTCLGACGNGALPEAAESSATSPSASGVAELEDGPLRPGRYRHLLTFVCEKGDVVGCPPDPVEPEPIEFRVTVPEGWSAATNFRTLYPGSASLEEVEEEDGPTHGPGGAGLIFGWTNFHVGLNSDPCTPLNTDGHRMPDIKVGPTVDDFVQAVVDNPKLDVTAPVDVEVGSHDARFFTLTGPADLSGCDDWRPWDPGFYAQGPRNRWDVWAVDVDGTRVVVVAQYFPGTPEQVVTDLREMAASVDLVR